MEDQNQHINLLIHACKKKDVKAQMELYKRYNQTLYAVAYQIVKNQADALDVMQEGFITAFDKLDQFQGVGSFEGWLRKIVVRKSIEFYHHNKRWKLEDSLTNKTELATIQEEEQFSDELVHQQEQINNAMHLLNDRYRLMLQLFYIEGYDHSEISEITGWSYSQCRTTLTRAKQQLKKKVENGITVERNNTTLE